MVTKFQRVSRSFSEFQQSHCDICGESITNPICPNCITKEVNQWMAVYPKLKKKVSPTLEKYLHNLDSLQDRGVHCIKCKKAQAICPYCFTDFVLGQLKKVADDPSVTDEFNELFDFDNQVPNPHCAKWTPIARIW